MSVSACSVVVLYCIYWFSYTKDKNNRAIACPL